MSRRDRALRPGRRARGVLRYVSRQRGGDRLLPLSERRNAMRRFEELGEAVVDVTKPAFEGIEDWDEEMVGRMGFALAAQFLKDSGYEVMESAIEGDGAPHALAVRNGEGEVAVSSVVARRLLGYMPEDIPSISPYPDEDLLAQVSELMGGAPVRPLAVVISFLSERIAHIMKVTYPLPE